MRMRDPQETIVNLVEFIKAKVKEAGKTGCIVGISGGIDSAVVAALCKIAYPNTTYGISLPRFDNLDSTTRATELCASISIPIYKDSVQVDQKTFGMQKHSKEVIAMAEGNFSARLRMAKLYFHAELSNSLVVGTDNACESFIGYFTKYGDGGVDINPLGKLMKSEVYELAKYLKIPESIINAVPSAELFNNHTDENELGVSYDDIEWAMSFSLKPPFEPINKLTNRQNEVLKKVWEMHWKTEHKRRLPPCCFY